MIARLLALIVGVSITAPLAQQPPAKTQESRQVSGPKKPTKSSGRELQPAARRDRRAGKLLPSDREEMQFDRWVRMAVRTYELDEKQEQMVRQEVAKIRQERKNAMGDEADEYHQLKQQRDAMFEASIANDADDPDLPASQRMAQQRDRRRALRKDPAYLSIQKRMREIEQKYALDMDAYILRIEQLLPEEQVRKAAEQRQVMDIRREQRRAEQEKLREARRARREEAASQRKAESKSRGSQPSMAVQPPIEAVAKAETGGETTSGPQKELKAAQMEATAAQAAADRQRQAAEEEAARQAQAQADDREKNMHSWEKHVRAFIQQYELTPRQANAAMSILQDSLKREEQYIRAYGDRIEAAKKIADKAKQDAELAKLDQPRQYLFKELTKRLDSLLTATQRAKVKAAEAKKDK